MLKRDLVKLAKKEGLPCPHILSKKALISVLDSWYKMKRAKVLIKETVVEKTVREAYYYQYPRE
jgi:hypothetical protein